VWAVVLVLFAAAAYEAAVAFEWIPLGSQPGQEASGQAAVTIAAFLALLTGIVDSVVHPRKWPGMLVPIAAVGYLVAHFYAFDSYYLPTHRRFSDAGAVSPSWVYVVAAASVIVAFAVARRPGIAPFLTPFLLLACAGTVVAEGLGH